jgi:hypothetical protein
MTCTRLHRIHRHLIGVIPARVLAAGPVPGGIDYPAIPPVLPGIPVDRLGTPFD